MAGVEKKMEVQEASEITAGAELPIRLLSYNVFMRPPGIMSNWCSDHKDARLSDIVTHVLPRFDVICMQEMFRSFSPRQGLLRRSAESTGHLHHVVSPDPSFLSTFQLIDGGLVILSRWPVLEHDHISYQPGVNADFFAAKGALYAKIVVEKTVSAAGDTTQGSDQVEEHSEHVVLHLFNTHLQASYDHNASNAANEAARDKQLEDLQKFIESKASLCASRHNEYIFLAGDLNVDARSKSDPCSHSEGYQRMLEKLSVPGYILHDLLHDTEGVHHVTVGDVVVDGSSVLARETVLTGRQDHGCMKRLDYILVYEPESLSPPTHPAEGGEVAEECPAEVQWRELRHSHTRIEPFFIDDRPYTQLSDHYAVCSEFLLPCSKDL